MKGLTIVLLVVLLAAAAAVPALADGPVEGSADFENDSMIVDCTEYGYGFEVWDLAQIHERWKDFYDKDGNWLRQEYHVRGVDHLYNKSYTDRFVEGSFHLNAHVTPGPEENTYHVIRTGVDWNIQLPGYGAVYKQSGLNELLFEWVGDDEFEFRAQFKRAGLDREDFEKICEYLQ